MEAVSILVSVALGYFLARVASIWTLYRMDQRRTQVIKDYDAAFLRSCHIAPQEEDHAKQK